MIQEQIQPKPEPIQPKHDEVKYDEVKYDNEKCKFSEIYRSNNGLLSLNNDKTILINGLIVFPKSDWKLLHFVTKRNY